MMPNDVAANARDETTFGQQLGEGAIPARERAATAEEREAWRTAGAVRAAEQALRAKVLRALVEARTGVVTAESPEFQSGNEQAWLRGFAAAENAAIAAIKEEGHE